ncbi:B12-binding domain-containing radical SAM protein [Patescibacteria group bacterium]|nr:B12-binding domain-containing radical SAM protein [Patescibacteria group bacterium]
MMDTQIILIRPPSTSSLDFGGSTKKSFGGHELELGLLYLASYLKQKGISVNFIDLSLYKNWQEQLRKKMINKKYDWAGLTAYTNFINTANKVAGLIKKYQPDIKTVIGGHHASALPIQTLEEFENFDFLVNGEGEETLFELITKNPYYKIDGLVWRSNKNEIIKNQPRQSIIDFNNIPFPDRDLLDFKYYTPPPGNYHQLPSTAILSSKGCPFKCTFCARTGTRYKNLTRYRTVDSILSEIKFCIEKYKIYDFRFYDDTFVLPPSRLKEFCERIIKEKIKISWNSFAHVNTVNKESLKLMKKAGCYHIKYGVEFGTQKWLDLTKKSATLDQARKAIKETKKAGIAAKASFIIGMPDESKEEVEATLQFAKELNPSFVTFGIFTPLPGSEIYDDLVKNKNLIHQKWDRYFDKKEKIIKNQLDLEYLAKKVKQGYQMVYFSPRYIIHRLIHLIRNFSLIEIKILIQGFLIIIRK